jgi:hypothetical protein
MVQKPLQHGLHADHEEVHKNNSGSNIVEPRTCLHRVAMFKCIQSKQYFPASQDVQRKPLLPIRSCSFAPRVRCAPVMECMAPDASMTVEERAAAALRKVTVAKRTSPYLTSAAIFSRSILFLRLHLGPYPSTYSRPTIEPKVRFRGPAPRPRCLTASGAAFCPASLCASTAATAWAAAYYRS